jgi:hypothetical protein
MEILLRNKFSSVGMLLGVIALLLSLVQFTFGPFSTKSTTLEIVVAEKVSAVKKGIIAGIKGEQPVVEAKRKRSISTAFLSIAESFYPLWH